MRKFFALARALPPSDHVPYAFEKRVMAQLHSRPAPDAWAAWARLLWCAAAPCVAIMLAMSLYAMIAAHSTGSTETLASDFERTVWGPFTSLGDSW